MKIIMIGLAFLLSTSTWAAENNTSKVIEELVKFHKSLVMENAGKLNTEKLTKLLQKKPDDEKFTEKYKNAIPFLVKLGKAESLQEKQDAYAQLVNELKDIVLRNSKANVFYCPMANKYWITEGDKIVNPYYKDMRDCGEKK